MNRARVTTGAAAALVIAVAAPWHLAPAARAGTPASPVRDEVLTITEIPTSDQVFNLGTAHRVAVGMVELQANNLTQRGHLVGRSGVDCVITRLSAGSADSLCTVTMTLPGGQLDLQTLIRSTPSGPGNFRAAITGGTGRFADAGGYDAVTDTNSQSPIDTLHITHSQAAPH